MQIIPAINCENFDCIKEKIGKISEIGADWAHIDVADGIFTSHKTWNNPVDLEKLEIGNWKLEIDVEVHLMVENPQDMIDDWIKAGVKRIIVHFEAIRKFVNENFENNESDILNFIFKKCSAKNIEFGLSINPDTPVETLMSYLDKVDIIQILAVDPGLSGQKFQAPVLDKIKFLKGLKENYLDIIVEVDGGIDLETAKICKSAGADILVSASYIWNSSDPKRKFLELSQL